MTRTPFLFNNQGWTGELIFFSVKKFIRNKETAASHYNLLPNQGHAIRIAMKLYKKFRGPKNV